MTFRFAARRSGLLAAACLLASPAAAQPASEVVAKVRAARLAQNATLAARMIDSAATFWTKDFVLVTSRGAVLRGKDVAREAFESDTVMVYVRTPGRIEAASPWHLAWEEGRWSGHAGAGGAAVIEGRYAAQWHRIDGRWLIRSEVFVALRCTGDPCSWPVESP